MKRIRRTQKMISDVISNNKLVVNNGNQLVDPLYVWDLAAYIVMLCNKEFSDTSIYNISGTVLSLNTIVGKLISVINKYDLDYQIEYHEFSSRVKCILDSRKIMRSDNWHQPKSTLEIIIELVKYKICTM